MYWLLSEETQAHIRERIEGLVGRLSAIEGRPQVDQIFPFVGRKDRRKARTVVEDLCPDDGLVVDPLAGSGPLVYAALEADRHIAANEWEPYAWRMASAPWRLPDIDDLEYAYELFLDEVEEEVAELYATVCTCGEEHVIDSLFFDLEPEAYSDVSVHERLGDYGENVTYRQQYRCPVCGETEKHFDASDRSTLEYVDALEPPSLFSRVLIENSRINLTGPAPTYGSLFPHRSQVVLGILWDGIQKVTESGPVRLFLEDVFLSVIPQAKYRDYRGKSQDLHVPPQKLREVNVLYRFQQQYTRRRRTLYSYPFSSPADESFAGMACQDFREFLSTLERQSADLLLTDPPWKDGNAYFEKAQLYHPWLGYELSEDDDRLEHEWVVTDAPSRRETHDEERWWEDADSFFEASSRVLKDLGFLALYFRPVPPSEWLSNLNQLKLLARKHGLEPLISIDVASDDPSMRIQQSASYVFGGDLIFVFLRLPDETRRVFFGQQDIDHLAYTTALELQEDRRGPFTRIEWKRAFSRRLVDAGLGIHNIPDNAATFGRLFDRYCEEIRSGLYLTKVHTPFSDQLFDTPAIERLFTYVPIVVDELIKNNSEFTFEEFLLALSTFVENGTRMLINQVEDFDLKRALRPYAEVIEGTRRFRKRAVPDLPASLQNVMELDPTEFEEFVGELLRRRGYSNVALMGRSGDRGVDIACEDPDGNRTVVQCKRWVNNVGSKPIQRLHSFRESRAADRAICVTTSDFTRDGADEAEITGTETVSGALLQDWIAESMSEYFSEDKEQH